MPVFFFLDPDMLKDHGTENTNYVVLSYTFFKTGEELSEPNVSRTPGVTSEVATKLSS
jgi:cytochrome c oxidase assembly protein Cox11